MIGEAILELPLDYREVIILYYFQEMSIAEIATILRDSRKYSKNET